MLADDGVAVAHKMIRLIYILLSRRPALSRPGHRLRGHVGQEERPRWIKQLKAIGKWPAPRASAAAAAT
jgi:transposase